MNFSINETALVRNQLFLSYVNDGDSLIVENLSGKGKEEIRFLGIDAPESKQCRKLIQDERETHLPAQLLLVLGRLSLNFLIELIPPGTKLTVKTESKDPLDIYGRILAYVYLPDGRCVNDILVSEGYAKPYSRYYCSELTNYQILNMKAKNERKGLYGIVDNF
ncbi:MAG: thermonuclease family protein [Paludibacteraceae bacterium]|nr:thermonuclease family protein [Paludibacteraceae bacterium]